MKLSSCGIDCDVCKFTVEKNCPGCHTLKGNPFWAGDSVCDLFACADGKQLHDCGKCSGFPCEMLQEWANGTDDTTGLPEDGQRIKNLQGDS